MHMPQRLQQVDAQRESLRLRHAAGLRQHLQAPGAGE